MTRIWSRTFDLVNLTCGSFLFDLLELGERGRRQDLQVHTFPCLEEVNDTVHCHLENKRTQRAHVMTCSCRWIF